MAKNALNPPYIANMVDVVPPALDPTRTDKR